MNVYLFTNIPGSGKDWTLGVLAISKQDAREYINSVHGSGKFAGIFTGTEETMICGAATEKAQAKIHEDRLALLGKDY